MACVTRSSDSPAAPKLPSIPARLIASTISAEPMPLAIAPVIYAYFRPWSDKKFGSPSRSGVSGGRYATTGREPDAAVPSVTDPPRARANPRSVRATTTGERRSETASRNSTGESAGGPGTAGVQNPNGLTCGDGIPAGWVIGGGGRNGVGREELDTDSRRN